MIILEVLVRALLAGLGAATPTVVEAPAPAGEISGSADPEIPAVWVELAECESGGDWTEGDGGLGPFRGGLQFHPDTWAAFAPSHLPDDPAAATPAQQVAVAERVLEVQGWQAWPTCARKLELLGSR